MDEDMTEESLGGNFLPPPADFLDMTLARFVFECRGLQPDIRPKDLSTTSVSNK